MLFRKQKRKRLQVQPLPERWIPILEENVGPWKGLSEEEQQRLSGLIQVFLAEKNFEGLRGLKITEEIQVTIAAQACLLLLGIPHEYYRNVRSVLVYPSTVIAPRRERSSFDPSTQPVEAEVPILGQAIQHGPVILVWDAALRDSRHPHSGHNVIYHEFAHKLDMLDGSVDGTPPLRDREEYQDYIHTCQEEFQRLQAELSRGQRSFLDEYASTNAAEFFAVATEQFFEQPRRMQQQAPNLYRVLKEYYQQDPLLRD